MGYFIAITAAGCTPNPSHLTGPACALAHSASVADVVLIYKVLQADSADSAAARKKNTVSLREAGTQIMRSHCYVNCACPPTQLLPSFAHESREDVLSSCAH